MTVLSAPKLNAKATEAPKDATLPVDSGKVHIQIVGTSLKDNPLVFVDGQKATTEVYNDLQPDEIESISVLKDKQSIEMYGEEGRDGVIIIKTKKNGVDGDAPVVILTDTARGDVKIMIDALNENPPLRLRHSSGNQPIIIVDGKKMTKDFKLTTIDSKEIESVTVLKDNKGVELYGEDGKEGVIIITKKK
ncbi:MAG: hypothetical protein EOM62_11805 [Bacteroidia bacterium]|nr:hypothetical protein [Bacteroidia bacterium]